MSLFPSTVRASVVGLTLAFVVPATAALHVTFNFDSVPSGSAANLASRDGITFQPGAFLPAIDSEGSMIPGSETWRADGSAEPVTVGDPSAFGRGAAPSPINALNALFQPVLVQFAAPEVVRSFSLTLDNDPFGDSGATIGFYDAGDRLLSEVALDQTKVGAFIEATLDLSSVTKVVLPAGAFYDNLSISSIPEPGPVALVVLGALSLGSLKRRVQR